MNESQPNSYDMKQTLLTAFYSSFITIALVAVIGALAPSFVIHWFGGVTRQEFADFAEQTPGGRAPVHIWQWTDGSNDVRYLGSSDGKLVLSLRGAAKNENWHISVQGQ
jgi:hypothetical protein